MKNSIIYIFLITLLISFGCKKVDSATIINNKTDQITKEQSKMELIDKLGGNTTKKPVKITDANFMSVNGKNSKLSDYKGKIIMLNLWATWCPPCRAEMPSMEKLHNNFKNKDFVIIAVSQGEDIETVKKFLNNNNYSFPLFIDKNNEIAHVYSTGSIPTTYLIDKEGYFIARFIGGRDWYSKESIDLINELLK